MNKHESKFLSLRRRATISTSLALLVFAAFYFSNTSAKTEQVEGSAENNLTLGRLAFARQVTQMGQERWVETSNPDGSGRFTLPTASAGLAWEPAWSPDGTKIAYAGIAVGFPAYDIWAVNPDGTGDTDLTLGSNADERNPSWSVTGKIAYERRPTSTGTPEVWTMNADGTGQALFSSITQPSPTGPTWSADGTKLAFSSGGDIWVINADGTNQVRLSTNPTTDVDPAWSPDGSKIVFGRGASGLATINADGTGETPLTTGNDSLPAWSPDGAKIAFKRSSPAPNGVYTMDASGGNLVNVIPDSTEPFPAASVSYWHPAWQPVAQPPNTFSITGRLTHNNLPVAGATVNLSGTTNAATTTDAVGNFQFSGLSQGGNYKVSPSMLKHYFTPANRSFNNLTSNQSGNFEVLGVCFFGNCVKNGKIGFVRANDIFVINPDGTGSTNITNNAATDTEPSFAPDGSVIFTTNRTGNNEIYRMNSLDNPSAVNLTNNPASDTSPSYSFDGKSVVFVSNRDGNPEIYRMNADGTNPMRLTNNAEIDSSPAISPDGQKIIFVRLLPAPPTNQRRIFVMNADGSNQQQLSSLGGISPSFSRMSFSPDGAKIIFTYSPDSQSNVPTTTTMNSDGTNATQGGGQWGSYSPDGFRITYTCCPLDFQNSSRLYYSNQLVTPTDNGNSMPDWQPLAAPRPAQFDFDGDSRSDISNFRPSNAAWYILRSTEGLWVPLWGLSTDVLAPADYDGDLKTDVAVWRPSDGNFYVLNSFDGTVRSENFGLAGDVPTGGDFDGDGKADIAVYRSGAQSVLYYRASMGNPQGNITFIPWGVTGDKPVVGDYDGDGRTDAAIFRPSNGVWYVRKSSDGQLLANHFGISTDVLVPADYDGDGRTDVAVFRDGIWYLLRSSQGFTGFQFGLSGDIPAPADYDGDGRADAAIFRGGVWWTLKSQSGTAEGFPFGLSGDKPVPSAYVR